MSIRKQRLGADAERRLVSCSDCGSLDLTKHAFAGSLFSLEMLDEVEELDLLTAHYSIAWAYSILHKSVDLQQLPVRIAQRFCPS